MPRIGKYTGTVYADDYDFSNCPECCTVVTDDQVNDQHYKDILKLKNLIDCSGCLGCPTSNPRIVF